MDQQMSVFCEQHYDRPIIFLSWNCYSREMNRMCKTCKKNMEKMEPQSQSQNVKIQSFRQTLQTLSQQNDVLQQTEAYLATLLSNIQKIIYVMKKEYNQIKDRAEGGQIENKNIEYEISNYLRKRQRGVKDIEEAFGSTQQQVINLLKIQKFQEDFQQKFDGYSLLKLYQSKVFDNHDGIYDQQRLSELFSNDYQQILNNTIQTYFDQQQTQLRDHKENIKNEIANFQTQTDNIIEEKQRKLNKYKDLITQLQIKQSKQQIQYQQQNQFIEQFQRQKELLDEFRLFYYSQQSSIAELTNLGTLSLQENHDKLVSIYSIDYFPIIYDSQTNQFLTASRDYKFSSYHESKNTTYQNRIQTIQSTRTFELDNQIGQYDGELNDQNRPQGKGKFIVNGQDYYNGDWQNGMRHGKGEQILRREQLKGFLFTNELLNGRLTYSGDWKENQKNGQGEILGDLFLLKDVQYQNDQIIRCSELRIFKIIEPITVPIKITDLNFENDVQTTEIFQVEYIQGDFTCIYKGELNNLQFHGQGKLVEQIGQEGQKQTKRKLIGLWENGIFKKGKEIIRENDNLIEIYDGEWNNNCKYQGEGTQTIQDYQFFINKFFCQSNEQGVQGQGKYVGDFVNGQREGTGKLKNCDGIVQYEGDWKEGYANGNGKLIGDKITGHRIGNDKIILEGNFVDCYLHGRVKYTEYLENQKEIISYAQFRHGLPQETGCQIF